MNTNFVMLLPVLPAIILSVTACIILLLATCKYAKTSLCYTSAQLAIVLAFIANLVIYLGVYHAQPQLIYHHSFLLDRLSFVLQQCILLAVGFSFCYAKTYNDKQQIANGEFYALGLFASIGMLLLVGAQNLVSLYLSLELLSLPTYAMVALQKDRLKAVEAGLKYFVIGSLASGLLLYGFSLVFGITRSLNLSVIASHLQQLTQLPNLPHNFLLAVALVFIMAGLIFKVGGAPFHLWIPDVYQGAPTSSTLFISAAPKIAVFGLLIRLLVETLPTLQIQWQPLLIIIAIASMAIGNIAAIIQTNIKRMLAYSSIAHVGYMLLGLLCATKTGYAAAMFYMISYALMSLAAFGFITLLGQKGIDVEEIEQLAGLNNRHPLLALCLLITLFSLAGIPPLVGFIAKLGVLEALIQSHLVWLSVVAIIFAIIGAYYYLRVVKAMYFDEADNKNNLPAIQLTFSGKFALAVNTAGVLAVGIIPSGLFLLCHWVFYL